MSRWLEQWERAQRLFERFRQIDAGRTHDQPSDNYQDDVYAFFQNRYHLKDWLKNDPVTAATVTDVEQYITGSQNLTLCADLCNGSKHLELKRPRGSADTKIGRRQFNLGLTTHLSSGTDEPPTISAKYEVEAAGQTYDAFAVAQACIADWQAYLNAKGLL